MEDHMLKRDRWLLLGLLLMDGWMVLTTLLIE